MNDTGQPDLFGHPGREKTPRMPYRASPGHRGVFTQVAAAEKIAPVQGRLHRMIVEHLLRKGAEGATRLEMSVAIPMKLQTVCARVRELVLAGELKDTDATRGGGRVVVVV